MRSGRAPLMTEPVRGDMDAVFLPEQSQTLSGKAEQACFQGSLADPLVGPFLHAPRSGVRRRVACVDRRCMLKRRGRLCCGRAQSIEQRKRHLRQSVQRGTGIDALRDEPSGACCFAIRCRGCPGSSLRSLPAVVPAVFPVRRAVPPVICGHERRALGIRLGKGHNTNPAFGFGHPGRSVRPAGAEHDERSGRHRGTFWLIDSPAFPAQRPDIRAAKERDLFGV